MQTIHFYDKYICRWYKRLNYFSAAASQHNLNLYVKPKLQSLLKTTHSWMDHIYSLTSQDSQVTEPLQGIRCCSRWKREEHWSCSSKMKSVREFEEQHSCSHQMEEVHLEECVPAHLWGGSEQQRNDKVHAYYRRVLIHSDTVVYWSYSISSTDGSSNKTFLKSLLLHSEQSVSCMFAVICGHCPPVVIISIHIQT